METELDILKLADYSERFTEGEASAYLIINKNITAHPCMFGFEKLPEYFETVQGLFEKIENKARELGYSEIIGPLNHNTWMNYRWATDNYDRILFPDCTNPPYYVDYIKRLGYDELYTYRSAMIKIKNPLYEIGATTIEEKEKEGFTFKRFDGDECLPILHDLFNITRDAFLGTELYSDIPKDSKNYRFSNIRSIRSEQPSSWLCTWLPKPRQINFRRKIKRSHKRIPKPQSIHCVTLPRPQIHGRPRLFRNAVPLSMRTAQNFPTFSGRIRIKRKTLRGI